MKASCTTSSASSGLRTTPSASAYARLLFTVRLDAGGEGFDHEGTEALLIEMSREWDERLKKVLIDVYGKDEQDDLSPADKKLFRQLAMAVKAEAVAKYKKWLKEKGEVAFNFFFSISSFACVIIPISITLPLTIPYPELFPGLAVPMVFFPAMAWFTVNPLFKK